MILYHLCVRTSPLFCRGDQWSPAKSERILHRIDLFANVTVRKPPLCKGRWRGVPRRRDCLGVKSICYNPSVSSLYTREPCSVVLFVRRMGSGRPVVAPTTEIADRSRKRAYLRMIPKSSLCADFTHILGGTVVACKTILYHLCVQTSPLFCRGDQWSPAKSERIAHITDLFVHVTAKQPNIKSTIIKGK